MENCIFCKIVAREIPTKKIYEDELVIAFLDHRPVRKGHTLIIPKVHVDNFIDLDNELAQHIFEKGLQIGRKMQTVLRPKRVGFVVAGFGVPHAHYHVIPMWDENDITSSQYAVLRDGNIAFTMDHIAIVDAAEQDKLTKDLSL